MRAPISWLREYVATSADAQAIAALLTARGFTVDAVEPQPMPAHIVVGAIETLARHPNADRLQVGTVDVGAPEKLQIVTGATNVHQGDRVPIALVGAEVFEHGGSPGAAAGTKVIRKSALRGVDSAGMMCSSTELALPGEFEDGILILDADAPIGEDFWKAVRLGDAVLDVDVPANRPDCLSIIGLARELAAGLGARWQEPAFPEHAGSAPASVKIEIADPKLCRRFVGQGFTAVRGRATPMWMTLRLHAAGVRSRDFMVDVSNYAMLETGQPLHFYDTARINGGILTARASKAGEKVVTLDGTERALPAGTPVIADAQGIVGVAGVFGGASSGVSESTTHVFAESANFDGAAVRRAAVALGLRTEASARNEKNLPVELPDIGRRAAARLLVAAGATPTAVADVGEAQRAPRTIPVRTAHVNRVLGTELPAAQMRSAIEPIGFTISGTEPLAVVPPFWRGDVSAEIDVVEEIARCIGYDAIPERQMNASPQRVDEGLFNQDSLLARRAAALGYREAVTLALQGSRAVAAWERSGIPFWPQCVPIANPLSDEQRFLRPSLLPGLLEVASRSWPRAGGELRLFELGHVFRSAESERASNDAPRDASPPDPLPQSGAYEIDGVLEWPSLCLIAAFADGGEQGAVDRHLLSIKGEAESLVAALAGVKGETRARERAYFHPGAAGTIDLDGTPVAKFGRLHPRLARAYDLPEHSYGIMLYLEDLPKIPPVTPYVPIPRFPGTQRDIAVVVDEAVTAGELMAAIASAEVDAFESVTAFDEYRGPQVPAGKKSIALTLRFRKADTTITDDQAEASLQAILALLRERFSATQRGGAT